MNKPITPKEMKDWVGETWDRCQKEAWGEPMNRDDIIRMAREVGAGEPESLYGRTDYIVMTRFELERFAALVAAAEREACAITCEQTTAAWTQHLYNEGVMDCVNAIRARGEK